MKSIFVFVILCLIQTTAKADPQGTCSDFFKVFDEVKFQRLAFSPTDCVLKASPNAALLTYRAFMLSSQGKLMVFDSYNGSSGSGATAAKSFHFFPRDRHPTIVDVNGKVEFQTANNKVSFRFDQNKAILNQMIGGEMTIDHNVTPTARGGLVIVKSQSLMLESGFLQGSDPTSKPKGNSLFRDSKNQTCSVVNTEVFEYFNSGDNMFKFTDSELKDFLKERCPQIDPGY